MEKLIWRVLTATLTFVAGVATTSLSDYQTQSFELHDRVSKESPRESAQTLSASINNDRRHKDFFESDNSVVTAKAKAEPPKCYNKKILPIWRQLKREFMSDYVADYRQGFNCSDMFEVKYFDLNGDGEAEILVRGKSFATCGGVGNCAFWIFQKRGRTFRSILSSSDYWEVSGSVGKQIRSKKRKGYNEILLTGHFSASDTYYGTYSFNGKRYVESKCRMNIVVAEVRGKPKWGFVSCDKYFSNL